MHITTGSVNGDIFYDFIECYLQPQLLPFDDTNPKSVILDNAAINHAHPAIELIEETAVFLLPYPPDYMPIEECRLRGFL